MKRARLVIIFLDANATDSTPTPRLESGLKTHTLGHTCVILPTRGSVSSRVCGMGIKLLEIEQH